VPVLTRKGDRFIAHVGESLLTSAGLRDWIAADAEDFLAKAAALAADPAGLAALRQRLRPRFLASPLCDGPRFGENLTAAFEAMWRARCAAD
jgi:predicted O-linked N-acetylglucosamine transferase (SPINDLY family)